MEPLHDKRCTLLHATIIHWDGDKPVVSLHLKPGLGLDAEGRQIVGWTPKNHVPFVGLDAGGDFYGVREFYPLPIFVLPASQYKMYTSSPTRIPRWWCVVCGELCGGVGSADGDGVKFTCPRLCSRCWGVGLCMMWGGIKWGGAKIPSP